MRHGNAGIHGNSEIAEFCNLQNLDGQGLESKPHAPQAALKQNTKYSWRAPDLNPRGHHGGFVIETPGALPFSCPLNATNCRNRPQTPARAKLPMTLSLFREIRD
jgi:hypothetical protein